MPKIGLYVFARDCRITDNPSLLAFAAQVDCLLCVYCVEPLSEFARRYSQTSASEAQRGYLKQTLIELNQQLASLGQVLLVVDTSVVQTVKQVIAKHTISHIGYSHSAGSDEQCVWQQLQGQYPDITFINGGGNTLFNLAQLPFSLANLPHSFSAFRKQVDNIQSTPACKALTRLPPAPETVAFGLPESIQQASNPYFSGGEIAAQTHLLEYFASPAASDYKNTRNALQGERFSTQFSPYLAHGSLSARQILHALNDYEDRHGVNESTYWMYFELLWREYFYWYACKYQQRLFWLSGIAEQRPLLAFSARSFADWCHANTPYPLVNALMRQLNLTGWMSNRGRQIVASCLINELGVDWRYGAAYFEQRLIDYDVASNWGNWQYIAGVGADPRGGRHFNLEKQRLMYDPDGKFVDTWLPQQTA